MQQLLLQAQPGMWPNGGSLLISGLALLFILPWVIAATSSIIHAMRLRKEESRMCDARGWNYRAEGAMNLIVAYSGPDVRFRGKVLRLRKRVNESISSSSISDIRDSFRFLNETIRPIIGDELICSGELVPVKKQFLQHLRESCEPLRPKSRLHTMIDLEAEYGWLIPDLCFIPSGMAPPSGEWLSVEVKPKSGVLPSPAVVSKANQIKCNVSRYTMMQRTKLKSGKVDKISEYDPLDLFSGHEERVEKAIAELIKNPQNNFACSTCNETGNKLNHSTMSIQSRYQEIERVMMVHSHGRESLIEVMSAVLRHSGVLTQVKKLQEMDTFGIEMVFPMYQHLENPSAVSEHQARSMAPGELPPVADWEGAINNFLVSQSAKDCAVMLCISPSFADTDPPAGLGSAQDRKKRKWIYRCALIDLDVKARSKIPAYWAQDQEILASYIESES